MGLKEKYMGTLVILLIQKGSPVPEGASIHYRDNYIQWCHHAIIYCIYSQPNK